MKTLLEDLRPGDEFEYVITTQSFRRGRFVVLDSEGCYLRPIVKKGGVFIFSFFTNKVCQHNNRLDVNLISKTKENDMKNSMGHFTNWKFGKPQMAQIDSSAINDLKRYPTATLNIDDKTIELSDETVAELRKKLGV